ncbi:hypothetical protein [Xenococcus sp. PCC 7305]|uniref:hypothetical protein n=1 Tax=Xenococcus sp. PCC 7305 TaxID=102125 RepID=UPI0002D523C7|nr:hypothetical protein [Xenococcus sp. PCC 7305]
MTQQLLEAQVASSEFDERPRAADRRLSSNGDKGTPIRGQAREFDALAFEIKHFEDYQRLNTPYYELTYSPP